MSSTHRPDFEALRRESPNQQDKETKYVESYLWPYINLEDLVQSKPLLLLLNACGRNLPDVFAHTDYYSAQVGRMNGVFSTSFLNRYTMLLNGQTTPETYGQLVAWRGPDDAAFQMLLSGIGYHSDWGLRVLKIQQRLLRFLIQRCHLICMTYPRIPG